MRIPVYNQNKELKLVEKNIPSQTYNIHKVKPKETKWRLAYKYGMTISELDSLNPILVNGLKIGQEIRVRNTYFWIQYQRKTLFIIIIVFNHLKGFIG